MPEIVLYADDDENDVFFMERAFELRRRREALRIVRNGRRAIEYLAGEGEFADRAQYPLPNFVVLDLKMPGRTGLEVLVWIRAQPALEALPVTLLTSSGQESDVEFCRHHGADGYLVKPTDATELERIAGRILEHVAGGKGRGRLDWPENQL